MSDKTDVYKLPTTPMLLFYTDRMKLFVPEFAKDAYAEAASDLQRLRLAFVALDKNNESIVIKNAFGPTTPSAFERLDYYCQVVPLASEAETFRSQVCDIVARYSWIALFAFAVSILVDRAANPGLVLDSATHGALICGGIGLGIRFAIEMISFCTE